MPKKLLAKYNPIDCDKDGWWICEPRPDNSANCVEVTETMLLSDNMVINKIKEFMSDNNEFYIIGQWGEQTDEGQIQKGKVGDFILQNREDPSDVWVVARRFFNNTYNIISE